ncbi:MAG: class I SAM-dependent methyltransferase [Gemmatimonadota bacterium]|nr:class I SAM-dependent methyltransferase [Gemmatimonadota bacterium]
MAERPREESWRRLIEDATRVGFDALLSLQERLRRYAGMPGAVDETGRTGVREDVVISGIADFLGSHPRDAFRVLDACCGYGNLAVHLANNLGDRANRVAYFGVDLNAQHIHRARRPHPDKRKLGGAAYRVGEIWDLPGEWRGTMDLVVLSNTLHELAPHRFPDLFESLNSIIAADVGRICVIDMEELPPGDPEAVAINWKMEEAEAILKAGGFEVSPSKYPKSVGVLRVQVKQAASIDHRGMLGEIAIHLRKKLGSLARDRAELDGQFYEDDDSLLTWIVLTGSVARLAEELLLVEQRLAALPEAGPRTPTDK